MATTRTAIGINTELYELAYQRTLRHAQKHLSKTDSVLSFLNHQRSGEILMEILGKTIGRPFALAAAGVTSLLGSVTYYFLAMSGGYSYDFSIFTLLLAAGFLTGWSAEIVWLLISNNSSD